MALAEVPDPRDPRGVRHALPAVIAMAIAAVLAGSKSFYAIGQWIADAGQKDPAGLFGQAASVKSRRVRWLDRVRSSG
jgi:membrane protein DedA with SNARE-associated domain